MPVIISQVLPLADAGWALGSVNTPDVRRVTYSFTNHTTNTPPAVTVSEQIHAMTVAVDFPLVLLSS